MTITEFRHGYWYTVELKSFAAEIGVPHASKLRKDELEALSLKLPVTVYTNDAETKEFLERQSRRLSPEHKQRSGTRLIIV